MNLFFCLALGGTVFFTAMLVGVFLATRTSRATMQRIQEVTHRGRSYHRDTPVALDMGRRLFTIMHWVRAKIGLTDEASLPERLGNAGFRGTFPVDVYNAARILCPLVALAVAFFIPMSRVFWLVALPAAAFIGPNIVLTRLINLRREKIRRSILDVLD